MNFQEAEQIYRDLKKQHAAGKLSDADFEAQVAKLRHQDGQGRWWQLSAQTGEWSIHDGEKWVAAEPPTAPAAPSPAAADQPTPPVELPPAPTASVAPPPPPAISAAPFSADPGPAAHVGATSETMPARRRRGSSGVNPILIGIIAVVAVVAVLVLLGGYLLLSGALGGGTTARVTTTPTRSLALVPSPVVPTITKAAPTGTPLPSPTIEVTATAVITPTRTAAKPTATKKPATAIPAGPTATKAPNVPPGVYVTGVETIPANAVIGDKVGFKVSFLNTTGAVQTYNWYVKVYQCPDQCVDFKHSYGETLHVDSNVPVGASAFSTLQTVNLGAGIRCELIAIVNYVDPVNPVPNPFQATKNNGYFSFNVCH